MNHPVCINCADYRETANGLQDRQPAIRVVSCSNQSGHDALVKLKRQITCTRVNFSGFSP